MRSPNFFILGAPKCGTTSLALWLSEHPLIYFSPWKEPRYFDRDLKSRFRPNKEQYLNLFQGASDKHRVVGEATVWYLYSRQAVPIIERELPGARYIVMFRNPVEMAYALHEQMVVNQREHIRKFELAWRLSPERREGRGVRPWVAEPRLLDYQALCRLGEQYARLLAQVESERVLALLLDDLERDAQGEYIKTLDFLGVPDDGRMDFPPRNPAKRVRSHLAQKFLLAAAAAQRSIWIRLGFGQARGRTLMTLTRMNQSPRVRQALDPELRRLVQSYFEPEVLELGGLLNRDLSHWLATPETPFMEGC